MRKRIYVICPAGLVTGGSELLHQLVHALRVDGQDANIAYVPLGLKTPTPAPFHRYSCPVAWEIPDEAECVVVVPETFTSVLAGFRRAQHMVWWLSVDNYTGSLGWAGGWKTILRRLVTSDIPRPTETIHLFQSAYAREYVRRRFRAGGLMLSDYLADEFFLPAQTEPRSDVIAFNPRKGIAFTKKLMQACPRIAFLPLENMSREEMRAALSSCKVYIDFGYHPGKDRIPREAAMCGAVVIVGRRGSAAYDADVPLDACYKISPGSGALGEVARLVEDIFARYEAHFAAQKPFRDAILRERQTFQAQVSAAFGAA